ncbi:MAG: hypothetical protein J6R29_03220 [Clostridia bacterium]|nr:hypothetical protein [Clostridia bacterium]
MKNGKIIALSAISSALCTILLVIGAYFPTLDLSCLFMASLAVTLPLSKNSYKGAILTYFASLLLALIFASSNFTVIVCFALFFGLHPILNYYLISKNKKPINIFTIVKVLWFTALLYVMYYLLNMFVDVSDYLKDVAIYVLFIGGVIIGFIYDVAFMRIQKMTLIIMKRLKL